MPLGKHTKIGISWAIISVSGAYLFYQAKRSLDKKRYETMKIRERMRQSNAGEYPPSYRKFST